MLNFWGFFYFFLYIRTKIIKNFPFKVESGSVYLLYGSENSDQYQSYIVPKHWAFAYSSVVDNHDIIIKIGSVKAKILSLHFLKKYLQKDLGTCKLIVFVISHNLLKIGMKTCR